MTEYYCRICNQHHTALEVVRLCEISDSLYKLVHLLEKEL